MATKKNAWMNYISEKMVHINKTADGKEFANISIACPKSKTGLATIAVNLGQVIDATKKDGSVVEGMKNVLLGDPAKSRKVSIATNKKGTNFKTVEMTNQEIAEMVLAERQAYRAAQKAAAPAEAE